MSALVFRACFDPYGNADRYFERAASRQEKQVWQRIQHDYTPMADLLKSQEFQQVKQNLERLFGPVSIGVELHRIGGTLYGVRRTTKTDH